MQGQLPAFSPLVRDTRYCHLRPFRRGLAGLHVACAGMERCLPEYRVNRADFASLALEFVAEGEGTLTLNGQNHSLRAGNAFLYGPGVAHAITTTAERPMRKYFVDFFGAAAAGFLRELRLAPGELRRVEDANATQALFDELIREGQRGGRKAGEIAECYLRLLLHKVAEMPAEAGRAASAAYRTWRRCDRALEENFKQLKGLGELSRIAGVDPSHVCRLYQQFGSSSPHAELSRRKMNHAAMLLLATPLPAKEIAAQVGYADPLHFSRVFRRHFGRGPAAFRKAEARTSAGGTR